MENEEEINIQSPPFRWKRFLGFFFVALFTAFTLLVILLPTLLSTDFGKRQLARGIHSYIPGTIDAQRLNLSWLGRQSVEEAFLRDPMGSPVLHVKNLEIKGSLLHLLWNGWQSSEILLKELDLYLVEEQPGVTNLHRALGESYLTPPLRNQNLPFTPVSVTLEGVNGSFSPAMDSSPQKLALQGKTTKGSISGEFLIEARLENHQTDLDVKIDHFPTVLLDQLIAFENPSLAGIPYAMLGDTFDLSIISSLAPAEVQFQASAKGPLLTTDFSGVLRDDVVTFKAPSTIAFTLTPELVHLLASLTQKEIPLTLLKPAEAKLQIEQLVFPLAFLRGEPSNLGLKMQLQVAQADLSSLALPGPVSLRNVQMGVQAPQTEKQALIQLQAEAVQADKPIQFKLKTSVEKPAHMEALSEIIRSPFKLNMDVEGAPVALLDKGFGLQRIFQEGIGDSITLHIDAERVERTEGPISFALKVDSDKLHVSKLLGVVDDNIRLVKVAPIDYQLQPELIKLLSDYIQVPIQLERPSPVQLTLNQLILPLPSSGRLGDARIEAQLLSPALQLTGVPYLATTDFKNLSLSIKGNPFGKIAAALSTDSNLPNEIEDVLGNKLNAKIEAVWEQISPSSIAMTPLKITLTTPYLHTEGQFKLTANSEPTGLQFHGQMNVNTLPTAQLAQENITLDLDGFFQKGTPWTGRLDLLMSGRQLHGHAAIDFADTITLRSPLTLNTTVTPSRFHVLRAVLKRLLDMQDPQGSSFALLDPAELAFTLHSMTLPRNWSQSTSSGTMVGTLTVDKLHLTNQTNHQLTFDQIVAQIDSPDFRKKIVFDITGKQIDQNTAYPVKLSGSLEHLFATDGSFNPDGLTLSLKANTNHLPADLICQLVCVEESIRKKLSAVIGETMSVDVQAQIHRLNGNVQANLKGKNGKVNLDATIQKGIMTLNKPFAVEIAVTPELDKTILEDLIPILSGVTAADRPITITIDPKGFALPLLPWDIKSVQIGQATVDLGKMVFNSEGQLGTILGLLKITSGKGDLSVWFTPLYLQLQDGTLKVKRMDMLALNNFTMALWGKIDLIKDKVDMKLGLTGWTLSQALKLTNIPDDAMLPLPLKGTLGEASIDKVKAAARISALVAQHQGSPQGLLIGAVLGIASGTLTEEKAPPPTTNPLPWANLHAK